MEELRQENFYSRLHNQKKHYPLNGQVELTYCCNLNCVHCYCKGLGNRDKELSTLQWKKIINEIQAAGCLYLTFTGGEPLMRKDFLELYTYAKRKGFIITVFTNGCAFSKKILHYLAKSPPFSIEITLNGITEATYESITQVKGSFPVVMENIKKLKEKKLPLIIKSNLLKQNQGEITRIKAFADKFLGKSQSKYHFKYDPMIYPCFNGDKTPTNFRLSFQDLMELRKQDVDIWQEYQEGMHMDILDLERTKDFLYHCNSFRKQFFINPFGRIKFCELSEKFSANLKTTSFKKGFYKVFPKILKVRFKTDSQCKICRLRPICYYCPARAYLETGNEESPVEYYCQLAEETERQMQTFKNLTQNEESLLPEFLATAT